MSGDSTLPTTSLLKLSVFDAIMSTSKAFFVNLQNVPVRQNPVLKPPSKWSDPVSITSKVYAAMRNGSVIIASPVTAGLRRRMTVVAKFEGVLRL